MKKFLFTLIISVAFFFNVNADEQKVCKISGSNDNVEVFSAEFANEEKTLVNVTVSNDSKDIHANVTVTVEVTYKNGVKKTFVGKDLAKPQTTTQINVKIDPYLNNTSNPATSVECTQITGAECI